MAFDTIGNNLIVADAYYGIWSVDLSNGRKTQLVSPKDELDGKVIIKHQLIHLGHTLFMNALHLLVNCVSFF